MNTRRGLGRGLGALIPTAAIPARSPGAGPDTPVGAHFAELDAAAIRPNPRQPRQDFDAEQMAELVASIREVGLLQPVVVRPLPRAPDEGEPDGAGSAEGGSGRAVSYELVMGERRWRAGQEAGLSRIPAIVRDTADDAMLRDALLENLHRAQLNPLEEAAAYQQLLDDFGCTHDELAGRVGRSRPQVTNTLRLLRLTGPVQRRVASGVLSAGHARALVSVTDAQAQERLALRVVAEGLSVRTLEEIVVVGENGRGAADGTAAAARTSRSRRIVAPRLHDVAERLSERLDTRVKVHLGARKGRITVEFASLDDLERIVATLDPAGG